jgi:hypothetical protein
MSPDTSMLCDDRTGRTADRSACATGQSPAGASEASALGSTQSYCFTPLAEAGPGGRVDQRRDRLAARAMLWTASSLKAVRCCGRMLHNDAVGDPDDGQAVVIKRRQVNGQNIASLSGLMTCGSVWSCPRCSAVIAHERALEIGNAVRECYGRGGSVYLLTLTMRHRGGDKLGDLWDALGSGWRNSFGTRAWTGQKGRTAERGGRLVKIPPVMGDAERFDIAGVTRVVEATYGPPADGGHGWHLHIHALLFAASSIEMGLVEDLPEVLRAVDRGWLSRNVLAARFHERWSAGLRKLGYREPGCVAVDLREVSDSGAEYVGRYLSKATYDAAGKMGFEMAAGLMTKDGRAKRNRTPFQMLSGLASSIDAHGFGVRTPRHWSVVDAGDGDWAVIDGDTGEVLKVTPPGDWRIWHEWEQASKGRRQIMWSRKRTAPVSAREWMWNALLEARGTTSEETDESLAARGIDGETLGEISREDWYRVVVWRPSIVADVIEAAESSGAVGVAEVLAEIGVALKQHPPPWLAVA